MSSTLTEKIESLLIVPDNFTAAVNQFISQFQSHMNSTAQNKGITFDRHVTKLVKSSFLQLIISLLRILNY